MSTSGPRKFIRAAETPTNDSGVVDNNTYNDQSGVRKVSDFGKALKPLLIAGAYTTAINSAPVKIQMGSAIAVYNNSGSVASITFGSANTVSSLAAGVTSVAGDVGIPLMPNSWTYLNNFNKEWAITSASTAMVFLVEDDTHVFRKV